ncbi:MAG: calcium-binding protein [Asticcacaulis sp.]
MTSLTSGADALTGTGSNDTFTGDGADLSAADTINGNGGSDTLSLTFAGARTISSAQLSGLTSVETLDVSFGGSATTIVMNPDAVTRADLDQFAVLFGTGDLSLDVSAVTSGQVFVGGAGQVTLQNTGAQNLWVASGYTGHIAGSTSDDTLYGASGADTLSGGDGNDYIDGSTGNDTIDGGNGDDTLYGGSSGDAITGGAGDDVIDGGASSDTIDAGDGNDLITCNAGNDTVAGGLGTDVFTIGASSGNTTITDFSTATTYELIDLSEISAATDLAALSVSGSTNATFTIGGHTVTLTGVNACCLTAANFIFYNDPKVYTVAAGTDEDIIQHLIDTVPDGSTIHLNSGDFTFDKTLHIQRNNITLEGDSSGTTIHSWIASEIHTASQTTPGSTIAVESLNKAQTGIAYLTSNAAECDTVLHLNTTAGIVAGSIIYIAQSNDEDYLEETGNTQYDPGASPRYYLREFAVRVSAVSGSDVTIELPLPYSFTSGSGNAYIALEQPITGVHVDDLTIANEIKSAGTGGGQLYQRFGRCLEQHRHRQFRHGRRQRHQQRLRHGFRLPRLSLSADLQHNRNRSFGGRGL